MAYEPIGFEVAFPPLDPRFGRALLGRLGRSVDWASAAFGELLTSGAPAPSAVWNGVWRSKTPEAPRQGLAGLPAGAQLGGDGGSGRWLVGNT